MGIIISFYLELMSSNSNSIKQKEIVNFERESDSNISTKVSKLCVKREKDDTIYHSLFQRDLFKSSNIYLKRNNFKFNLMQKEENEKEEIFKFANKKRVNDNKYFKGNEYKRESKLQSNINSPVYSEYLSESQSITYAINTNFFDYFTYENMKTCINYSHCTPLLNNINHINSNEGLSRNELLLDFIISQINSKSNLINVDANQSITKRKKLELEKYKEIDNKLAFFSFQSGIYVINFLFQILTYRSFYK